MKITTLLLFSILFNSLAKAQNVGIGTNTPQPSAILDVQAGNKGMLIPRVTAAQKTAIANPVKGLLVYQTDGETGLQHFDGTNWKPVNNSGNYVDLSSNQNIDGSKKFLKDIVVNQMVVGHGYNNIETNLAIGKENLVVSTGERNVALGFEAMKVSQQGSDNVAIGAQSLFQNIAGSNNVVLGSSTLRYNSNGGQNVGIGGSALLENQTGSFNTAAGFTVMNSNISGNYNSALGNNALGGNVSGNANVGIGLSALTTNVSGSFNTAIGGYADVLPDDATYATAVGAQAIADCSNCVVLGAIKDLNYNRPSVNVGIGVTKPLSSLHINPDGAGNILVGINKTAGGFTTMQMGISDKSNGHGYLQAVSASGSSFGTLALNPEGGKVGVRTSNAIGDLHVKQSAEASPVSSAGLVLERRNTADRWNVATDQNNSLTFVFNGTAKSYINYSSGAYVTVSDARFKKDIQPIGNVLDKVLLLQPKKYHYKDNNNSEPLSYGLIAQELEKLFPDFVSTGKGDGARAVAYDNLIVVAIKAIQEQQTQIEALKRQNKLIMERLDKR